MKETDTHLASPASAGTEVTTYKILAQVQKPTWGEDAITWDSVPHAVGYLVRIYKDGETFRIHAEDISGTSYPINTFRSKIAENESWNI